MAVKVGDRWNDIPVTAQNVDDINRQIAQAGVQGTTFNTTIGDGQGLYQTVADQQRAQQAQQQAEQEYRQRGQTRSQTVAPGSIKRRAANVTNMTAINLEAIGGLQNGDWRYVGNTRQVYKNGRWIEDNTGDIGTSIMSGFIRAAAQGRQGDNQVAAGLREQAENNERAAARQQVDAQRGYQLASRDPRVEGDKDAAARAQAQFTQHMNQIGAQAGGGAAVLASMNVVDPSSAYTEHRQRADEQQQRAQQTQAGAEASQRAATVQRTDAEEANRYGEDTEGHKRMSDALSGSIGTPGQNSGTTNTVTVNNQTSVPQLQPQPQPQPQATDQQPQVTDQQSAAQTQAPVQTQPQQPPPTTVPVREPVQKDLRGILKGARMNDNRIGAFLNAVQYGPEERYAKFAAEVNGILSAHGIPNVPLTRMGLIDEGWNIDGKKIDQNYISSDSRVKNIIKAVSRRI